MQSENNSAEPNTGSGLEEETSVTPSPVGESAAGESPVSAPLEVETVETIDRHGETAIEIVETVTEPVVEVAVDDTDVAAEAPDVIVDSLEVEGSDIPAERFDYEIPGSPNVKFRKGESFTEPRRASMKVPAADALALPSISLNEIELLSGHLTPAQVDMLKNTPEGNAWLARLAASQQHVCIGNSFDSCQHQPNSEWDTRVEYNGERYGIARPRFSDDSNGGKISGLAAIVRMQQVTNMGALLRFPLYHTGIWITLKAASDASLLELDRQVQMNKVSLGTSTYGMVYSNSTVVSSDHLLRSILERVYTTTAPSADPDDLIKLIDVRDWNTLIWGALSTQYPDGYPYERGCITGMTSCNHVVQETILLHKLPYYNLRRLTQAQRKHMSLRTGTRTVEELKAYRDGFVKADSRVQLNELTSVILRSPTMAEYLEAGHDWIDSIKESVDATFGGTMSAAERDDEIIRRARASSASQYAHYIERIVVKNPKANADNFIEGVEDIRNTLAVISGDEGSRDKFFDAVSKYIDDESLVIYAIPRYECPACTTDQGLVPTKDEGLKDLSRNPYLIPLDMLGLFFTITARRISRVAPKTQNIG